MFLYLGSLRPYKGVEELLDGFEHLGEQSTVLVIAGSVPDPAYLERVRRRAASPRVMFVGRFVPNGDLQFYFNAADAVVLPFRDVLTSASLVLAMGFGRMVIAPRLGCVPDYADAEGCLLYDPDQPQALEAALRLALSRDVEACGRRNLARARRLDWGMTAARTAEIYASLPPKRGSR